MEQQLERERPPAYTNHDPDTLHLPSVPQHDPHTSIQLPDIKSLGLPSSTQFLANGAQHTANWQSPPAQHIFHTPVRSEFPRHTSEVTSPAGSVMSHEGGMRAQNAMNVDDPETRMAAEALSALGKLGGSFQLYPEYLARFCVYWETFKVILTSLSIHPCEWARKCLRSLWRTPEYILQHWTQQRPPCLRLRIRRYQCQ